MDSKQSIESFKIEALELVNSENRAEGGNMQQVAPDLMIPPIELSASL